MKCIGSHSFVRTYTFLSFPPSLRAKGATDILHFLSSPGERNHLPPRARYTRVYKNFFSYWEPFYLIYDSANAIDKTVHLSLTLYGDRLSRLVDSFLLPPPSTNIIPAFFAVSLQNMYLFFFFLHSLATINVTTRSSFRSTEDRVKLIISFIGGINLFPGKERGYRKKRSSFIAIQV